jgi:hypothetical protein
MGLAEWLNSFRELHERARAGKLSESELRNYHDGRDELATALIGAQRLTLDPALPARHSLRVARAVQVDFVMPAGKERCMTLDLSLAGFSAMMGRPPPLAEPLDATLRMPDGVPIETRVLVQGVRRQGASHRVSFAFKQLPPADEDRLGFVIFDVALSLLRKP